ncbi:hypothetical protein Trydic_g12803 [Trypoxylus dichotomus]
MGQHWILFYYVVLSSVYFLIYLGRLIHFFCKGSESENYRVRLCLSSVLIVSNVIFCVWLILDVSLDMYLPALLVASLCITLSNGTINLVVLYLYNTEANTRIKEIAGNARCCKKAAPENVEANNTAAKTNEEYDAPPNYEEAIQAHAVYADMYQNSPPYEEICTNRPKNASSADVTVNRSVL